MAEREQVIVACRLPNGIELEHKGRRVVLNGANKSMITGSNCGVTSVDRDFWEAWFKEHAAFGPIKSGAITASGKTDTAVKRATDSGPTGFESLKQKAMGVEVMTEE